MKRLSEEKMKKPIKFFVIGCGSIGERHIKNLNNLSAGEILVHDINKERLQLIKKRYNIDIYKDIEEAFYQSPDAVLVCTPPYLHISIAMKAVDHDAHVFIEKPISYNLDEIDDFLSEVKRKNLTVLIGYMLRFHPGIQLMKKMIDKGAIGRVLSIRAEAGQYLPDWRPWQDYRQSYTAKSELGGGIILDGSHEIDYVQWLLGRIKEVSCFSDKISNLDVNTEDTAEILLRFENDIIGEIHLDFTQRDYARNCKIIGEEGTIIWSYPRGFVKIFRATTKQWKKFPIKMDTNGMYMQEMKHFLDCISGKSRPLVTGDEAKKVLEIVLAAKESAKKGRVISI